MRMIWVRGAISFVLATTMVACGNLNLFEPFADKTSKNALAESVRIALDKGLYDEAIADFTAALAKDPADYALMAELASAYSARAGFDFLHISLSLARYDGTQDTFDYLSELLPGVEDADLDDIQMAKTLLDGTGAMAIPAGEMTSDFYFQLAFVDLGESLMLSIAETDTDGDNVPDSLSELTEPGAQQIYDNIIDAKENLEESGIPQDGEVFSALADITSEMEAMPGSTATEKALNFLADQFGL